MFWFKWAWRDLRQRWVQVVVVGIVLAMGTGVYVAFGGQEEWRTASLDASYNNLHMHDLKIELADGSFIDQEEALSIIQGVPGVAAVEGRLIVPTLVDASNNGDTILVQGEVVGVDVSDGLPEVNGLYIISGEALTSDVPNGVMIDDKFTTANNIAPGDTVRISGNVTLDVRATGYSPEYFQITSDTAVFQFGDSYAPIFAPLETVQQFTNRDGLINDLVVLITPDADRDAVQSTIETELSGAFPDVGFEISVKEDDPGYSVIYADAEADQAIWDLIAFVFLLGAALGVFNLTSRLVTSQRRQIGIGMALGVPTRLIALRPLLVGVQIALVATVFGVLLGRLFTSAVVRLIQDLAPLPYWEVGVHVPSLVIGVALGITLPLIATLIPVWRAVRVQPIDAIKTGHLVAKGGGFSKVKIPGTSFIQMPVRNLLRAPWRTLFTMLGVAMAILLLVTFSGFADSMTGTINQGKDAYLNQAPDRVIVGLDFFYPVDEMTDTMRELSTVQDAQAALMLGGTLNDEIDVLLEFYNMDESVWVPELLEGTLTGGIVISDKAAEDLGLVLGDTVTLRHPQRQGLFSFNFVETPVEIVGIHSNPIRAFSYMDLSEAESLLGVADVTNMLILTPDDGLDTLKEQVFQQSGVTSVQSIGEIAGVYDEILELFVVVFVFLQGIVVVIAFLLAFNTTSINVDERVREIATMFAFGLPVRIVARMQMLENLIVGIGATIIGSILGWWVLDQLFIDRLEEQLADIQMLIAISPTTLLIVAVVGLLAVTLTPIFSLRKMRRMDIPSQLRVME